MGLHLLGVSTRRCQGGTRSRTPDQPLRAVYLGVNGPGTTKPPTLGTWGWLSYVEQDSFNLLIRPAPLYLFYTSNQILSKESY